MDPSACIARAEAAARDMDFDELIEALDDYTDWKRRGGFTNERDDARFEALSRGVNYFGGDDSDSS